jgi:hypothetical protein
MKRTVIQMWAPGFFLTVVLLALASPAFSQGTGTSPQLQEKVAALKQSVAMNQQALRRYTWTESQETIFKGETKSTKQSQCQYGPDGKVQKTSLSGSQPPPQQQRGLKGRIIEKKKDEMQDYMERVASLIQRYVPPEASQMQESFQFGKAALQPSGNGIALFVFRDYAKPGDTVTLTFETAAKMVRGYDVNSYLDAPEDVVTLKVVFDSLPDGTNYAAQSVLDATAKQIQIRTTNSNYRKL